MSAKERIILWLIMIVGLGVFLAQISSVLLPFVVAGIMAYFLDPAVDRLERMGMSRVLATSTILGSFLAVLVIAGLLLVPLMYHQFLDFSQKIPEYLAYLQKNLIPRASRFLVRANAVSATDLQDALSNVSGAALGFIGEMLRNIWQSGMALVNLFSLIFITPIVTFYILRDWDKIVTRIDKLLPRIHAEEIRQQCRLIDKALSGYIRGQTNVCLLLGTFYAIGLSLAGLQFGFLIGFFTGILSFIPYVGMLVGTVTGLAVAFFQFDNVIDVAIVAGVFIAGQILEGNFVTPKLVGDKVGLSPVWLIFGMLAGAALFGFIGILIAVPITAILGVLTKFLISKYMQSSLYLGKPATIRTV